MAAIMKVFFLLFVPCEMYTKSVRDRRCVVYRCISSYEIDTYFSDQKQQKQQQQKLMNKKSRSRNHIVQNEDRTHKHIKTQTANAGIE